LAASSGATDIALNVGAGVETTLTGLAQALADAMGRSHFVPLYAPERAVNPVRRRLADTRGAREQIGFEAAIPLHEGLRNLVAWWRLEQVRNVREAAE
jgi:UDP-glucose 4-epimerase